MHKKLGHEINYTTRKSDDSQHYIPIVQRHGRIQEKWTPFYFFKLTVLHVLLQHEPFNSSLEIPQSCATLTLI